MLTIRVIRFHGQMPEQALAAQFDESGGTVGRATTNNLVLPDPERHISRIHASIAHRNGGFVLMDQGSANPVILNGRSLGNGVQAPLADGDELRIGDYVLQVSVAAARTAGADGLSGAPLPTSPPPAEQPVDDPLALFGGAAPLAAEPLAGLSAPVVADPLAGLAAPAANAFAEIGTPVDDPLGLSALAPGAGSAPASAPPPVGGIPDDFDPFGDQFGAKPLAAEPVLPTLPDDFELGFSPKPAGGQSIDALFGLGPASGGAPDPFAPGSALGDPGSQPNTAAAMDPLAALGMAQPAAPAPVSNHVLEVHGAYTPPAPAASPTPPAPPPAGGDMFLSWDEAAPAPSAPAASSPPLARTSSPASRPAVAPPPSAGLDAAAEAKRVDFPKPVPPVAPAVSPPSAPAPARAPAPAPAPAMSAAPTPAAEAAGVQASYGPPANEEVLRAALLRGLGLPHLDLPHGMGPETMLLLGLLLRESVQGTLDLLLARAMTKREIRAEVTMIVGRDNNPLKFSPDVAVALGHLLAPQGRGFMAPAAAMHDAYDDLRAHTFGFMAGMRAALAGVLGRFDPEALEARLSAKSVLDSVLPMNRRAKLWDLFAERYQEISREAEEDFHTLFGKAFLKAYQEQVDRLREAAERK